MKEIYLDHAATTKLDSRVLEKMIPFMSDIYGNPNSQHFYGRKAMKAVDEARDKIARIMKVKSNEIYFTSGGTESDNWALRGVLASNKAKGKHVIMSKIEHHAMLTTAKELEREGYEFTYLDVDGEGFISLDQLKQSIRNDTVLIACMFANNEIGTIEPIQEIVKIAKEHNIITFTDAVQAVGSVEVDVKKLGVDLLSFSGHKFNGPKGVGVLYIRNGLPVGRLISGGHQERSRRGGTTNVPSIVGLATALELAINEMDKKNKYIRNLRDTFVEKVTQNIEYVKFNGATDFNKRLPNNANFSFKFVEGESILFSLDISGIAVSSGSACSSGSLEPSHVLLAIGMREEDAHGSIRFTFGTDNTMEDVDYTVEQLKNIIQKLRAMSPLFSFQGEIKNV